MNIILGIFLGGGLGSLARYGVSKGAVALFPGIFPLGTLLVNLLSCAVVAGVVGMGTSYSEPFTAFRTIMLVGFCGGFSTFSTFGYETFELMRMGHPWMAVVNVLVSVVAGLAVFYMLLNKAG